MNFTAQNVAILTLALSTLASGIEKVTTGDWQTGGALVLIGVVLVYFYEKTPPSTPAV